MKLNISMLIRFLEDYDYRLTNYLTVAYLAGMEVEVEEDCGTDAITDGAAELIEDDHDDHEDA